MYICILKCTFEFVNVPSPNVRPTGKCTFDLEMDASLVDFQLHILVHSTWQKYSWNVHWNLQTWVSQISNTYRKLGTISTGTFISKFAHFCCADHVGYLYSWGTIPRGL